MHSTDIVVLLCLVINCFHVNGLIRVKRIIGGSPADIPPSAVTNYTRPTTEATLTSTEQVIYVKRDERSALVNGVQNDDGTYSFLGIRYAEPPVGRFRFQRPRKLKLKGEVDATKFGPPCAQWKGGKVIGSEDCLFLNIFTPKLPDGNVSQPYPVLFWIHGGNFKTGSAAQYIPRHLVRKGIIVVTIQYRLGSLGFLSIGRKELPGNSGLFDIATALRWIHDYIKYFGGNPNRIVPGGQGSGASSATMLALNKYSRRRVSGIFAMSGSPISPFSLDDSEIRTSREVSKETRVCDNLEDIQFVRCMQQLPLETILKADSGVQENRLKTGGFIKGLVNLLVPGPSEEGEEDERFLPHFVVTSPFQAIKHGLFPPVPLLTGITKDETGSGCRGNFFQEIKKKLSQPSYFQSNFFMDALQANKGLLSNKTINSELQSLFRNSNYVKFFGMLVASALSDIEKIIKQTTDAFFTLPAFITSHLWSKKSNVFLYSFEHIPKKSLAEEFLSGIPLISPSLSHNYEKKGPEHGDDLMYLFDIRSIEGAPLENPLINETDSTVREYFCTMVAEFVASGKPRIEGTDEWKPFSAILGNYMVINDRPKLVANFRKCEMGLWTGDYEILRSPECSILHQAAEALKKSFGQIQSPFLKPSTIGLPLYGLKPPGYHRKPIGTLPGIVPNPLLVGGGGGGLSNLRNQSITGGTGNNPLNPLNHNSGISNPLAGLNALNNHQSHGHPGITGNNNPLANTRSALPGLNRPFGGLSSNTAAGSRNPLGGLIPNNNANIRTTPPVANENPADNAEGGTSSNVNPLTGLIGASRTTNNPAISIGAQDSMNNYPSRHTGLFGFRKIFRG
ncbi:hypothetical protein O3M35_010880 [Rhynocoris fuscipes]|uniref:Carboxylesterase type B domain-containing protein n=1 Tax=Rhynocoris fuscipes TaxID=488301 RepID=A0AAW1D0U8_9HEMI